MSTARALDFHSQDLSNTMWALPGSSSDSSDAADNTHQASGAAHCLHSKQPAAAAAAATTTTTRVQHMPRPRGREARRLGKAKMQAKIDALQTQCEHLQLQVKTLQTQCGLLTDLLDEHVCGLLPAGHPSPA
eukprot:12411693-Karenia_brevis.AAC.1